MSLRIVDAAGRLVRTLASGPWEGGTGSMSWDGRDRDGAPVPSGIYFYVLKSDDGVALTGKLSWLR
jgi:flagellar hook assembly protein FlgD